MPTAEGLEVVLHATKLNLDELQGCAQQDVQDAKETSAAVDRLEALFSKQAAPTNKAPAGADSDERRRPTPLLRVRSWEEIRSSAALRLEDRGITVDTLLLDDLLQHDEAADIESRFLGGYTLEAELDALDVAVAVTAGVAATIVDFLLVGIPKPMRWNGAWQNGSALTKMLRSHSISNDNWLAQIAKVPFDTISGLAGHVDGIGPSTHRVHTFGHDPLVGLLIGTLDIMRGTATAVGKHGQVKSVPTNLDGVNNPFLALTIELMHLLSDVPTHMGLPLPGWSVLMTLPYGDINGQNINHLARQMYLRGYDSWHFMTMATVPATVNLILRGYWGLRNELDEDFRSTTERQSRIASNKALRDHPKFAALNLVAHSTACAGNITKLIAYGGNPLAFGYNEWLAFARAIMTVAKQRLTTPTDVLIATAHANSHEIDDGWTTLTMGSAPLPTPPYVGAPRQTPNNAVDDSSSARQRGD